MMAKVMEIFVEDNPDDVALTLRAFRQHNLARDGEEALNFIFCSGPYAGRDPRGAPSVILLDLKLPKIDGIR
jgi:two-component system, response regulator